MIPTPLNRWSMLFLRYPHRYLEPDAIPNEFDIRQWAVDEYTWEQDPFGGWFDTVSPVSATLATGRGDCDDFACVVASALVRNDAPVYLGVCTERHIPRHVVVSDGERCYESGGGVWPSTDTYLDAHDTYDNVSLTTV